MSRTAALGLLLALLGTAHAHAATPPRDEAAAKQREEAYWATVRNWKGPRETEIREALGRYDFTALEQKLEALQRDYEAGSTNEYFVFKAFEVFEKPDLQPAIERWATDNARSWSALAARGTMRWAIASRARGKKYVSETSQTQRDQMESYLRLASSDFLAVIKERPRFLPAYSRLIQTAFMLGNDAAGHAAIDAALRQDPNSYLVRADYMTELSPMWGGSFEAMDAFAQEAQAHAAANPELIAMLGFPWQARGSDRIRAKDWDAAVKLYTRAIQFGRRPKWLRWRAVAYSGLYEWSEALADLNEALHYDPDFTEALADRAQCLAQTRGPDAGLDDYARAAELAPDESWIVLGYARALYHSSKSEDAAGIYERLLATHPRDPDALEELGIVYLRKHQPDRARGITERLIEAAPKRASAWRIHGDVLFVLHDQRTRATYERYLELVDPNDPAESRWTAMIRQRLSSLSPAAMPQ